MASVNKVILVGNLGKDPDIRYMPSGDAVANITVATTDSWKDKSGEKQERTEWHRVSMFGKQAEIAGQYLKKGSQIYVEGSLQTRKWQDKDGRDQYTTEIKADRFQMLGGRAGNGGSSGGNGGDNMGGGGYEPPPNNPGPRSAPASGGFDGGFDDDIPFISGFMCDDPIMKR